MFFSQDFGFAIGFEIFPGETAWLEIFLGPLPFLKPMIDWVIVIVGVSVRLGVLNSTAGRR